MDWQLAKEEKKAVFPEVDRSIITARTAVKYFPDTYIAPGIRITRVFENCKLRRAACVYIYIYYMHKCCRFQGILISVRADLVRNV